MLRPPIAPHLPPLAGALEMDSRPGAGSIFTLRFPPERTALSKAA